jgi:FkbM family methyltransferase
MVVRAARRIFHRFLEARGYYVRSYAVLPYGVEYLVDIDRLSKQWNLAIRIFFDVGANLGGTTRAALKAFPDAQVVAFEPIPDIFSRLRRAVGPEPRFAPYQVALGEICGLVPFFENDEMSSLVPNSPRPTSSRAPSRLTVECCTLDAFCVEHKISHVDVLKIDAEGCELMVFRGSKKMLAEKRVRFIYAEFHAIESDDPKVQMTTFVPLYRHLAEFGFEFVATYTDWYPADRSAPMIANALFVLPP